MENMDFGYDGGQGSESAAAVIEKTNDDVTNLDTGVKHTQIGGEDVTNLDNVENKNQDDSNNIQQDDDKKDKSDLSEGQIVETDEGKYTVDKDGNLIDKNGNIFKEAKDVSEWIKSFDKVDNDETEQMNISTIQDLVGINITDENDKPVEFDNTPAGVKAYIDAVIETAREEHYETAINTLYQKYPILEGVINYYVANGGSMEGYGQAPDRSKITIDDTNEAQQEDIIRMAWTERRQKGDVNGYIAYLKSSGLLLATAKEELAGLQEADAAYQKQLAEEAERKENEQFEKLQKYWNGVEEVIKSRKIAGYQIPETIIINRNGQKVSVTPNDFFNYLYRVDENGHSAYEKALAAQSIEARRDDEILRAYLMFVGGNYSNLVDMAINDKAIQTLRLKSKERKTTSVRISNPKTNTNKKDIDFGY